MSGRPRSDIRYRTLCLIETHLNDPAHSNEVSRMMAINMSAQRGWQKKLKCVTKTGLPRVIRDRLFTGGQGGLVGYLEKIGREEEEDPRNSHMRFLVSILAREFC